MNRVLTIIIMAWAAIAAVNGSSADNIPVTISWTLDNGTITDMPALNPETTSQLIEKAEIVKGSGLKDPIAQTSTVENITQTMFPVTTKTSGPNEANAIKFMVTLKQGIAFTPDKVSFKSFRWKTDKGNFDATWIYDDSKKTLATGIRPNRGAGSGESTVSAYTYDLSGTPASEQQFGLCINIYNFDVAADKGLSLGDVVIEGTLYGTVGEPLRYTLTVTVSPEGAGTVQVTPECTTVSSSGNMYDSHTLITLSQQPVGDYIFTGWQTETGKPLSSADTYSFNIIGNTTVVATYTTRQSLMVGDYIVVDDITSLREAIKLVNEENTGQRRFIFLKNGDYDYGTYKNPESGADPYGRDTIMADNISLIGQSTEGVTIHIQPTMASVSRTAPIVINATGTYLQDFTLQNNYNYSGDDGQAAALMDKGHHTIGKNMRLISRQDTYYSNTDYGQLYFETSEFQGTVDYICGRGDVYFNQCRLMCVNRKPSQGEYKGDTHIGAPYTIVEDFDQPGGHGYIFNNCYIDCKSKTWDFGRGWRAYPKMAFLNSILSPDAVKRLGNDQTSGKAADNYAVVREPDYTLRVGTKGIQSSSDSFAMLFYEYNTMDEQGNVVSPASNILTFTASNSATYETILQPSETSRFQLNSIYPDWTPDEDCRQILVTTCQLNGNTLSWAASEDAKAFLIENDGQFITIVDGTTNTYTVSNGSTSGTYTVRAANMMGGFGPPCKQGETTPTTITVVSSLAADAFPHKVLLNGKVVITKNGKYYDLSGRVIPNP